MTLALVANLNLELYHKDVVTAEYIYGVCSVLPKAAHLA